MQEASIPENERQRLEALDSLRVLYTPAEERFDRITRMATRLFDTPISTITFIADRVQWHKSMQGVDSDETPREYSFCAHAILEETAFVIEDATKDPRFANNPLVTGDPKIRFYAGQPVRADDGSAIGTVCIIDRKARSFSTNDRNALQDLAALVEVELHRAVLSDTQQELIAQRDEMERKASTDGLTKLWNQEAIKRLLGMEISRATRGKPLTIAMIDVDNFKTINDTYGHPAGDAVIAMVADRIRGGVRDFDAVGRYGGDEFMAVLSDCRPEDAAAACERMRQGVAAQKFEVGSHKIAVSLTIGIASYTTSYKDADAFLAAADQALYRAKQAGRNRIAIAGEDEFFQPPGMTSWRQRKRW